MKNYQRYIPDIFYYIPEFFKIRKKKQKKQKVKEGIRST